MYTHLRMKSEPTFCCGNEYLMSIMNRQLDSTRNWCCFNHKDAADAAEATKTEETHDETTRRTEKK